MSINLFGTIRMLILVHSSVVPSLRRQCRDMEDAAAMAVDTFGGAHIQTLLVEYRRPMRENWMRIYGVGPIRLKYFMGILWHDG